MLGLQQLVLSQGISPDLCSYDGRTAMHCAAAGKHLSALRFLVQEPTRTRTLTNPNPNPN